ncbi:hypothetical protein [Streptomyces sp. NPDC086010]
MTDNQKNQNVSDEIEDIQVEEVLDEVAGGYNGSSPDGCGVVTTARI